MPATSKTSPIAARKARQRHPAAPGRTMNAAALRKHVEAQGCLVPQPPPSWMENELPRLLAAWGAFGGYVGMKCKAGRWTPDLSLVVLTSLKHEPGRGAGEARRVPKTVTWTDSNRVHRLSTDVLEVPPEILLQRGNVYGPGDGAEFMGEMASIGAAVVHPRAGVCVTTAGHLFGGANSSRIAASLTSDGARVPARLVDLREQGTIDYALLSPGPGVSCDNLFRNTMRVGPVFNPTAADAGKKVFVLDRHGQATTTLCRGVGGVFITSAGRYFDTIQTDPVTESGQSGGALVDQAQRLWGFLLGSLGNRLSLFAPAQLIFDEAGVQLFQG